VDKDLIIDASSDSGVDIALLEDKKLVELHRAKSESQHIVGDIYLGQVKRILPGLNAAFVDVGYEKDGFLHYLDLGLYYSSIKRFTKMGISNSLNNVDLKSLKEPNLGKNGLITDYVKQGQLILVQISKEPISTKGPRLSAEISFAGRFLVLVPFSNKVSISQKIKNSEERNRLKRLIQSIRPEGFGIIIRTVAEGQSVADLDNDLRDLMSKWDELIKKLPKSLPPCKMISEMDKSSVIIRDMLTEEFTNIYVNDVDMYEELKTYISNIFPKMEEILHLYKMQTPIFEQFSVANQIRSSFGKVVTIRSGIYLVIEQTEAMHVIDVNSGHRIKSSQDQEENALMVNCEAAVEIARQMRLRDLGGIIVIDFIDLNLASNRKILLDKMNEELRKDKAKHTVLPLSKFCLMQITRQRVRPAVDVDLSEVCPLCNGSGKIKSSMVVVDEIENDIKYLSQEQNEKKLTVIVHPFVRSYITSGLFKSIRRKWQKKYRIKIEVISSSDHGIMEYAFLNAENEEVKL
jgi:ribonuclease G